MSRKAKKPTPVKRIPRVKTRGNRYRNPNDKPLKVTPMTTAGPQEWHEECRRMRDDGYTMREIGEFLGVTKSRVQKFLNPESRRRSKLKQTKKEKLKRHKDKTYAKKVRDYNRRYAQLRAPERWVNAEEN